MKNRSGTDSWIAAGLVLLALVLAAGYAAWAAPGAIAVEIRDFKFQPASITVARGTRVTWLNDDEESHAVASMEGVFRSPALNKGERFSYAFTTPGTYHYFCAIHPYMRADVVVR